MNVDPRVSMQVDAHPYPLLFATISGAHLYGFPSPDSDYDLRGVHLLPLVNVVGLRPGPHTVEKSGHYDASGVRCSGEGDELPADAIEIDLVTHDVTKFFGLMLKKNGYVMEQLLSPLIVRTTAAHEELKVIAPSCLTRYHAHHYLGFATTQWKLFRKESPPRVKPLLYVYRVLLTGIHLIRTGQVEANLARLNETFRLPWIPELIERKISGQEKERLELADLEHYEREYARLTAQLEAAMAESCLPERATGADALNDLLVRLRLEGTAR